MARIRNVFEIIELYGHDENFEPHTTSEFTSTSRTGWFAIETRYPRRTDSARNALVAPRGFDRIFRGPPGDRRRQSLNENRVDPTR